MKIKLRHPKTGEEKTINYIGNSCLLNIVTLGAWSIINDNKKDDITDLIKAGWEPVDMTNLELDRLLYPRTFAQEFFEDRGIKISREETIGSFSGGATLYESDEHEGFWIHARQGIVSSDLLIGAELSIDDYTESKASISSAVGRAVVGGALMGGIGAVVGAGTARRDAVERARKIEVVLYTSSDVVPYVSITFLNSFDPDGVRTTSPEYIDSYRDAKRCYAMFENYINNNR